MQAYVIPPRTDDPKELSRFFEQVCLYINTTMEVSGASVDTSGTPVDNDYAKFTDADTVEGRSYSEVRTDLNIADGADVTADNETSHADVLVDGDIGVTVSDTDVYSTGEVDGLISAIDMTEVEVKAYFYGMIL